MVVLSLIMQETRIEVVEVYCTDNNIPFFRWGAAWYLRARTQNILKPQISFQRTETFNLSWNVSGDGKCFGIYIQYNYILQTNYMSLNFFSLSNKWNFNNSVNSRTCNIHLIQLYDIIKSLMMCCYLHLIIQN